MSELRVEKRPISTDSLDRKILDDSTLYQLDSSRRTNASFFLKTLASQDNAKILEKLREYCNIILAKEVRKYDKPVNLLYIELKKGLLPLNIFENTDYFYMFNRARDLMKSSNRGGFVDTLGPEFQLTGVYTDTWVETKKKFNNIAEEFNKKFKGNDVRLLGIINTHRPDENPYNLVDVLHNALETYRGVIPREKIVGQKEEITHARVC